MEFILNKIDPDLRAKIKATTAEGKIHRKTEIKVNENNDERKGNRQFSLPKQQIKKDKIKIMKAENKRIFVDAVKDNIDADDEMKGKYLDVRE